MWSLWKKQAAPRPKHPSIYFSPGAYARNVTLHAEEGKITLFVHDDGEIHGLEIYDGNIGFKNRKSNARISDVKLDYSPGYNNYPAISIPLELPKQLDESFED